MNNETLFPFELNGVTHYMTPELFNDIFSTDDEDYMFMTDDGFIITYDEL